MNQRQIQYVLFLSLFFLSSQVTAQRTFGDVIEGYAEPSYITLGNGLDFTEESSFEDTLYEAQLSANFRWWGINLDNKEKGNASQNGNIWGLYLPIRFAVRQFSTESSPVKTPTYNPGLRLIYANNNALKHTGKFRFWSLGIHHYSNGQSDDHLLADGSVNTETGSFSSDYLEVAYHIIDRKRTFKFLKFKYRAYLTSLTWEEDQTDFYEDALAEVTAQFNFKQVLQGTILQQLTEDTKSIELFLSAAYKIGKKFDIDGNDVSDRDKTQLKIEYISRPDGWKDMAVYLRWDYGNDYYNINYRKNINRLQIGVIGKQF